MSLVKNRFSADWKTVFKYSLLGSFLVLTLLVIPYALDLTAMLMQYGVSNPNFTLCYFAWSIEGIILIFLFAGDGEQNEAKTR